MTDGFGREIDYLRVSVTDRCNLRCRYCMPHGVPSVPHENILRSEEILRICRVFARLGVKRLRVTGGEPLVRKGVDSLLRQMRAIPGIERLALTTNGVLLKDFARSLDVDAVNISLDALDAELYRRLTGQDALREALAGIDAALARGFAVKINCVLVRGINESQIEPLAGLAGRLPVDVRFIELMPIGAAGGYRGVPGREALARLRQRYDLSPAPEHGKGGPARYYEAPGFMGRIGFIDPLSCRFCGSCNRVRLSSEGYMRLCLYHEEGLDLRAMLRGGASDEDMAAAIQGAVQRKPAGHAFLERGPEALDGLYRIGG